jgi:class 3 adenylate cyclase/tetratricopeptide (TPR) repeat protein
MSPIRGDEERRPVTVLFADIVGFTGLSERLDPEDVRDVTAACFGRLVEEVARRGGTVDKFIGDAVMALFGAPLAHEDDASRAIDAGLAMQATLGEINGELERDHGLRLELRIGVNTGEVVAGVRQVGGFHDFTVIGDTVNTASRLQAAADPGSVVVGETTARLAQHAYELEPLAPMTLRGKAEPVVAFRAIGPLESLPVADAEGVPMVGRREEQAILAECVERLKGGRGGVLTITGDPGVGKSRLLRELRRLVQADPRLSWVETHAAPYGPHQSYRMWAATLREVFGVDGLTPEEAVDRVRGRLVALGVAEALPFMSRLLGLPIDPKTKAMLSGLAREEIQGRVYRAMREFWIALGNEKPLVLAIDDFQWADPAVVELFERALDTVTQAPVLLCFAFRPDRDAPCWPLRERAAELAPDRSVAVELGPLREEETRELIHRLLEIPPSGAGAALGARAEARLLARVEGNPLFAQEVVRSLLERGALARRDGHWELDTSMSGRVPETLQATILARIDRLPEDARHVVQTGAVLGRTFSHQLLARVVGEGPSLERGLREAVRAGLLRERDPSPRPGYTFTQSLVQEVAERTLLVRRRREIHQAAMEGIEALYADDLAGHANGLVRHAIGAGAWAAATEYAHLAAERAASSYANRDALRLYTQGLEASERLGARADDLMVVQLLAGKATALSRLGRFEECAEALEQALERASRPSFLGAENRDPPRFRARLALDLTRAYVALLRVDAVDRALAVAFESLQPGQPELALAWSVRSWVLMQRGDLPGSAEAAHRALEIALQDGGFEERAEAYGALIKPALAGEIGPSIKTYAEEAVRLAREHQHDRYLFDALIGLEVLRLICLQPTGEEAVANALEAGELARKMDSVPAEAAARVILGATYLMVGRWDEAERELLAGETVEPMPLIRATRALVLSSLWTARGRLDDAYGLMQEALADGVFPHTGVWFNMEVALNRLLAGEYAAVRVAVAEAEAEQARLGCLTCKAYVAGAGSELLALLGDPHGLELADIAERAGGGAFPIARMLARRARSLMAMREERWDEAIAHLEAALALASDIGQPAERARTLRLLGQAHAGTGDLEAARSELQEALATFHRLGARPELELTEAQLKALPAASVTAGR